MESTNDNQSSGLDNKIVEYLNEMLSVENAVIDRLQTRIEGCSLQEGKKQLQHHLEETREQQQRLHQMISKRGGKPTDAKMDLPTLEPPPTLMAVKTVTDIAKTVTGADPSANPMDEEKELRKTKEDFGLENIEIISYRTLILICQDCGLREEVSLFNQSLKEEQEMADWIVSTNLPATLKALWPRIREEAAATGQKKGLSGKGTTTPPPAASA